MKFAIDISHYPKANEKMISVNKWSLTRSSLFLSPIVLMAGAAVNAMQLQNNTANTDSGSTSISVLLLSFGCWVLPLSSSPPFSFTPVSFAPSPNHHHTADPALCSGIIRALISDASGTVSGLQPPRFRVLAGSDSKTRQASHWEQMWVTAALRNWEKGRQKERLQRLGKEEKNG